MKIHKALHPIDDIDRYNLSRKKEEEDTQSIQGAINVSIQRLEHYINSYRSPNFGQTTRPSNSQQKSENLLNSWLCCSSWSAGKTDESLKRDKYLDIVRERKKKRKKSMEHEWDGDTHCNWCAQYSHLKICTSTGRLENKRTSGDHINYSIINVGQNTKNPLSKHQKMQVWKTL